MNAEEPKINTATFAEAMELVEEPYRKLLYDRYVYEMSYDEIAAKYMLHVGDVKRDMFIARELWMNAIETADNNRK